MTYRELARRVAAERGLTWDDADALLKALWAEISGVVRSGGVVRIPRVGAFYRKRIRRHRVEMRHPDGGRPETYVTMDSARLGFRPSKHAKWRAR